MKQRLLFITWHELDRNSGGPKASLGFIHCFAQLFPGCSVIYRELGDASVLLPPSCQRFPCHDSRSRLQKGIDMYRGILHPLHQHVKQHLRRHRYDLVVIDHSISAASILPLVKAMGARLITIHHNVERHYLRDNRREYPLLYRMPYLHYARKAERDCLRLSSVNLTLNESDATLFRSGGYQHVHAWGVFDHRPIADKTFTPRQRGQAFIITGSLCFYQSLLPTLEFVNHYWPLLRQAMPQATLVVAGRAPAQQLIDACQAQQGVAIIPNPADMAPLLAKADYYVCPVNLGSGIKVRITDALSAGLPVLCHEVSAAGYETVAEKGCLFAYHDDDTFRCALADMVEAQVQPDAVYRSYQNAFSVAYGTERLRHILQQENITAP